jgi:hypothetical protein
VVVAENKIAVPKYWIIYLILCNTTTNRWTMVISIHPTHAMTTVMVAINHDIWPENFLVD